MCEEHGESYLQLQDIRAEEWAKEEEERAAKLASQQYKEYFKEEE